ncbi:MAG: gamma-F420-2:alpha-L-glutamate ligase [Oceanicoccus sp.]|jgi:gamma-F420-2:alpha-L-glutamate ligase
MRIWVLTKKDRLKNYQASRFKEEAEYLDVRIKHICAEDFEIVEPSDRPDKIWHKGKYVSIPDVLITRVTGMSYFSYALVRLLQRMGVTVMNSANSIELAEDKLRTVQVLTAKELPIPKSILAKFPVDTEYIGQQLGYPLIMKTVHGAKGDGVVLFENHTQFKDVVTVLQKVTEGKTNLIFQRYVSRSFGRDLRVFVVGDQAIGAVMRQGAEGQFKANVSAGGSAQYFPLNKELSTLAVEASQALGLSISGVDFLFDGDTFLIGEVNSSPSFEGFETDSKANVPKLILEYAMKLKS